MASPRKPRPAKAAAAPIVQPTIQAAGAEHPFQALEKKGELPVLTSVGYARVSPESRNYVAYVIKSRGREVISMETSEPNLKAIAADDAKINFVTLLDDADQVLADDLKHIEAEKRA